jgi:hypothetical protein
MKKITLTPGNPVENTKESIERFQTIIKPILSAKGFDKLKGNSHIMISDTSKTVIIPKSCPSKVEHVKSLKLTTKELKKKYEGYSIYILFHRDTEEWYGKPIYVSTLRRIMRDNSLKGVICGMDKFMKEFKNIQSNRLVFAT